MTDDNDLKRAVESQHGGTATFVESVQVKETFDGNTVWDGAVSVFALVGHPKASLAYAWSYRVEGSTKHRFYAVLHIPPVDSPQAAVRAAIVAESRINLTNNARQHSPPRLTTIRRIHEEYEKTSRGK